ncbi:MAG: hypothetical protein M3M95_06640 [Pseudomonadota bacterium]|nr:hypothetical protein [Pseudomonadota bacterium]
MSFLIALAATAVLGGAEPATAPTLSPDAAAARAARLTALPASDFDIHAGLHRALELDPERVVCATRLRTGSKIPRSTCGSLRRWFDSRTPAEIADGDAPWQLVEEIKEQRRKAMAQSRGR